MRARALLSIVLLAVAGCTTTGGYHYFGDGSANPGDASGSPDLAASNRDLSGTTPADLSIAARPDLSMSVDACHDGVRDGLETDIDCGGSQCSRCANGRTCAIDADCVSLICSGGVCASTRSRVFGLASATTIALGAGPAWPVTGDFDKDGNLDVAVTNQTAQAITCLRGNGAGGFQPVVTSVGFYGYGLAAADFDLDGGLDLVLNNDAAAMTQVLRNQGSGSFAKAYSCVTGSSPVAITAADFNGDGRADFASTTGAYPSQVVSVMSNSGSSCATGTTLLVGQFSTDVTSGDFNGDGRPDIAATNFGETSVAVFSNLGAGSFGGAARYAVSANPEGLTVGDVNGDGRLDIVVAVRNSNAVGVLLNLGGGSFQSVIETFSGTLGPESLAVADLDLDGHLDAITANSGANNISVLLGTGTGTFKAPQYFSVGSGPSNVVTGDFNRDGLPDLVVTNFSGNSLSVLLNTSR